MRKLFHAAPILLAPDSIILPGNWGRIIQSVGPQHDRWKHEETLERIRAEEFPNRPSRMNSSFCCLNEETLRFYSSRNNRLPPVHYLVEKAVLDAPEHITDFNLISPNKDGETIEQNAVRYWQGDFRYKIDGHPEVVCEELLTSSPLRVLEILD